MKRHPFFLPRFSRCVPGQTGIALLIVLWVAMLLTVMATSFAYSSRADTLLAQNSLGLARTEALADAGVQRALFELFKPAEDLLAWKANGMEHRWSLDDAQIHVRIIDISAKIDLNAGDDLLLLGLFKQAGLNDTEAGTLLAAVQDWRDGDDLRRPNGAEAADYVAAGRQDKPANAPFNSVDELRRVLGMKPELFDRIADSLTVHSGQVSINPIIASRQVLMALPGIDPGMVEQHLQARQAALDNRLPLPPFAPLAGAGAPYSGTVYSIRAEARLADDTRFIRETVARLERNAARKVTFLEWREGTDLTDKVHAPAFSATGEKSGDRK